MRRNVPIFFAALLLVFVCAMPGQTISITAESNANALAAAITAGNTGISVVSSSFSGSTNSAGIYTNAAGTYGIGSGIVLSSGDVNDYNTGPSTSSGTSTDFNTTATLAQAALLTQITPGFTSYDVAQLEIKFTMQANYDTVYFNVVWGSEEYNEYVGTSFKDAFGLFIDGVNIAQVGGIPINVDHPQMSFLSGTELDGVLTPGGNPLLTFSQVVVGAGEHTMTFIISDTADHVLDSTAYISAFGAEVPKVPEPATLLLLGAGLIGIAGFGRKKIR